MAAIIVTASEAAQLVPDRATVALSGCLSVLEPDTVLQGIEARFLREGRPRDLTVIHPVMVGGRKGSGINRFAHDGLMRRVIGGSFSIFPDYEITRMIKQERVEASNLPIGTIFHWLRESGAGRPGLFTAVKFVRRVEQITFSGRAALEKGQEVLYITERGVFRLTARGLELVEVAPGIDPINQILPHMEFPVAIPANLAQMDPALFQEVA